MQPPSRDYFEFFGLPRNLCIDVKDLEKRFYALSRQWHPDLFARKSPEEQQHALDGTAILNDAYRTLRDPISRTMYLLKQEGFDVGEQGSKDVPPELLEEVFELNMALEEAEPAAIEQIRGRFEGMREESEPELNRLFEEWDASHDRGTLSRLRALLNRRKYIVNLIDKAKTNVPDRV